MAKKKLTTEQKIKRFKKIKRIKTSIIVAIVAVIIAVMIPATYYGYYYVVFTVLPRNDYNPDKTVGPGYSKPLHMIHEEGLTSDYVLAYYYDDCWHVIDDTQRIIESRNIFMIYKADDEWHEGTHLQLLLIRDNYMVDNLPLSPTTFIDARCFKGCIKEMTMEEFKKYISDHGFTSVFIK